MRAKHNFVYVCQINKCHLVHRKILSSMQEVALYFLQQSRLHIVLILSDKPMKSGVLNRHKAMVKQAAKMCNIIAAK